MKLRVPLYGSANKIVWVDDEATKGAVAGVNLYLSDGKTLVTDAMLAGGTSSGSASSLTTSDDLDEGAYHVYFTNRRAQDAVGGILANSSNVTLSYTGGTSITADLTDVSLTSGGTLKKRSFDAKGRLSQESAAATDDLAEGATNLYFTSARVLATTLTGLSTATANAVTASDSVLVGIGKLQAQATANATAIAGKEPAIAAGTTAQYWRGDKTWRDFATDVRASVLTGLSTSTSAVITAADSVLSAPGKLQAQITDNLLPKGYIDGLQLQWVSGTALTVTSGAAYIEGSSKVLRATSAIAKTGLSLSASTWYHVYLYSNAGTPDVEISTMAPASPYNGTARSKTGDSSRRYVGSVRTDASGNLKQFRQAGSRVTWYTPMDGAGQRVLAAGTASAATSIDLSSALPATATHAQIRALSTGSVASRWSNQDIAGATTDSGPGTFYIMALGPGSQAVLDFPVASNQTILYWLISAGTGIYCDVLGYLFER